MMPEVVYTHEGAPSEDALRAGGRVLAYKGSMPLPNDSREGLRIVTNSVVIPREITEKLSRFSGKFSLSQTKRGFSNAHVFTSQAAFFDGVERICYLQYQANALLVSEYGGRRGANYSALYPELARRLEQSGIASRVEGGYQVPPSRVEAFLGLLEEIQRARTENTLRLRATGEIDSIAFEHGRAYYHKVYWRPADSAGQEEAQADAAQAAPAAQIQRIQESIRTLAACSLHSGDRAQLMEIREAIAAIKEQLEILDGVCGNGLDSLARAERLGLKR